MRSTGNLVDRSECRIPLPFCRRDARMTAMKSLALPFLFLVFCLGCGKKPEPPILRIFCSEAYWDVMGEEAALFSRVYGTSVQRFPLFVVETEEPPKESEAASKRRSPAPWRTRPSERRVLTPGSTTVDNRIAGLIRSLSERTLYGDMYLTDSPNQAEMLHKGAAVAAEYPFCVLTLALLVAKDNPLRIGSVKSLLDAEYRLGIVDPASDGMGETAFRLVSKYLRVTAEGSPDERIIMFDRHDKLLAALKNGEIDGALVWEPLALKVMGFADAVELPESERQAVQQPLLALSMADNQGYGKRFADFLVSPKGREILKKHGF